MRTRVYSYKKGSRGARELSRGLGVKRLKHDGSRYVPRITDSIINWGSTELPFPVDLVRRVYNQPACIRTASNKLLAMRCMYDSNVNTVPFTEVAEEATAWGTKVVVRHTLTGKSGAGIEIVEPGEPLPDARLYTQYIKKTSEWRVHVCNGESFFIQRKVKDPEREVQDWHVRNHAAGFIYQINNDEVPDGLEQEAINAVDALDLDFGAVDLIYNRYHDKPYVLEVNTAPGLEGMTTRDKYIQAIGELVKLY